MYLRQKELFEMFDISVIIPTYNREKNLKSAVESVLEQEGDGEDFKVAELLIIDDGSTDNTSETVKRLMGTDDRIRYHRLEKNRGAGGARNYGVKMSGCTWVAFQDSDDLWFSNKLKVVSDYMKDDSASELFSHWYEARLSGGRTITVLNNEDRDHFEELVDHNYIGTPTMVVKRESFLEIGGFNESLRALEDWDFSLRFAATHKICVVPQVLMDVDLVGEGVSSNAGNYYNARCQMIADNKDILLERGLLKKAIEKLLFSAEEKGLLEQVGAILETYLKQ